MTPKTEERIDERLGQLLDVERQLEGRLAAADAEARALVALAHEKATHTNGRQRAELERASEKEEQEDLAAHAERVRRIEEEAAQKVAALEAVPEARVDLLARKVIAWLLEEDAR